MDFFKKILRPLLPQWAINYFYHLPLAILANIVFGFPTRGMKVIGVTGTDGKTTTINMIYQILKESGKKVSMVSTVNAFVSGKSYDTGFHVTSPDPFLVQKFAKFAKENGDEYLVLEVTSHALDQFRFWGIRFDVGVITNITHEHLDYHKTQENYRNTKFKLFNGVEFAVINENLKQFIKRSLHELTGVKILTFGVDKGDFNQKEIKLKLKLLGDYNLENALAALGVAFTQNIDRKIAQKVLEKFESVEGRMQEVKNKLGLKIIIDYAHTPNGLEQVLNTLRSHLKSGKLISLIGCEGHRDEGKRAMMGEIATRLSDIVVVTSVDPRGQQNIINRQISEGAIRGGAKMGENFFIIEDRQEAIDFAIKKIAQKGDLVGIFGKGHEKSMNMDGKGEKPWSDLKAVKQVLSSLSHLE
ncbi:UDP-N-acetylmuramoyl-L-alanyl-D-glutamate--2,6-diaminopimelate ligase [Candidatus Daviesbacteria bacterium]|nr:UDP-N-acetylmuramoyl-L-alanyl-D-glutamate--2,6-diaminopimelate ligase [Candidatus Daviesbacteria bacterium]